MNKIIALIFLALNIILLTIQILCYPLTLQLCFIFAGGVTLVLLVLPIEKIFKFKLPWLLYLIYIVQIFLTMYLGSAYHFYSIFAWWDLFVHGLFGFEACIIAFYLLLHTNKGNFNMIGFLIFTCAFAMGLAALWEITEYLADYLTGSDSQNVINKPITDSPVADTMEDLIITLIGVFIFDLSLFIDRHFQYPILKYLFHIFKKRVNLDIYKESKRKT